MYVVLVDVAAATNTTSAIVGMRAINPERRDRESQRERGEIDGIWEINRHIEKQRERER
jgi:hypothetical protein